jgi:hypothetical protein
LKIDFWRSFFRAGVIVLAPVSARGRAAVSPNQPIFAVLAAPVTAAAGKALTAMLFHHHEAEMANP